MEDIKQIEDILGPTGLISEAIPAYEQRLQQIRMASVTLGALNSEEILVIEAPTGTGKTLAYLVAGVLSEKKIAVSTGTKNLQEQIFYKDAPFLKQHVFPKLKTALMKGRGNFVCHIRFNKFMRQPSQHIMADPKLISAIAKWYKETCEKGSGDRVEMEFIQDNDPVWPEICSTAETCLGRKCPARDDCFVLRMRGQGVDANLMILNHHLLASDLMVRECGYAEVVPRYEALIVDEAHGLEDALTNHLGFHLSLFKFLRLRRDIGAELKESGPKEKKVDKALQVLEIDSRRLFEASEILLKNMRGRAARIHGIDSALREIRDHLSSNLGSISAMISNLSSDSEELALLANRALTIKNELDTILSDEQDSDYARWIELRDRSIVLHASPVHVGEALKSLLYEKVSSVVFTSATLSTSDNFEYFKSRMGLNNGIEPIELILDTPFDYEKQTVLFVPTSMPAPNSREYAESAARIIDTILKITDGRAFVLFTSFRAMNSIYELLKDTLPYKILLQGSKPKTKLLEEFVSMEGCVLFGAASFWEGVDVRGEALSCVIVDKLPFAPPDDPIISARSERLKQDGESPFLALHVPMAIIALRQGLGRLIRTSSDRGALVVLDTRIITKNYGALFLESLHTGPLTREPRDLELFFHS